MPELPEVEITARFLADRVVGEQITGCRVAWSKSLTAHSEHEAGRKLNGASIARVERRGKFVLMTLRYPSRPSRYLLGHMRMSGSFDVVPPATPWGVHDRVGLFLNSGREVRFTDPRKFGRLYLVDDPQEVCHALGVEPLSGSFTASHLMELCQTRRRAIKPFLLDQTVIAGIGNIYADESLWRARIHPLKLTDSLSFDDVKCLRESIVKVLREAIKAHGTDFGDGVVHGGLFAPKVYGQQGEPCARCATPITRFLVAQRGTHVCPRCQRAPR